MFQAMNLMKTEVHKAAPQDTVQQIIHRLGQERISGLPVVDVANCVVGVITELDILRAFRDARSHLPVADLMMTEVITIDEETNLEQIVDLFLGKGIRRVFVTRDKKLLGVISRRDLIFSSQIHKQVSEFAAATV